MTWPDLHTRKNRRTPDTWSGCCICLNGAMRSAVTKRRWDLYVWLLLGIKNDPDGYYEGPGR